MHNAGAIVTLNGLPGGDRKFDFGLCLEVLEHIPAHLTESVLKTIGGSVRTRLVMSWSGDPEGIGHVNSLGEDQWIPLVERLGGFRMNQELTAAVREAASVGYLKASTTVFEKV